MVRHLHARFLRGRERISQRRDVLEGHFGKEFPRPRGQPAAGSTPGFYGVRRRHGFHGWKSHFSAYSPTRLRGIRVIQYPPESGDLEFDCWLDTFGGKLGEPGVIRELVIACASRKKLRSKHGS